MSTSSTSLGTKVDEKDIASPSNFLLGLLNGDTDTDNGSFDIPSSMLPTSGSVTRYVHFVADNGGTVDEIIEDNNQNTKTIALTFIEQSKPDFRITSLSVAESQIIPGENLTIDLSFINEGKKSTTITDYWQIKYYLSADNNYDAGIDKEIASEDFGITATMQIDETWYDSQTPNISESDLPVSSGNCYLIAVVDIKNTISEMEEDDNESSLLLEVISPIKILVAEWRDAPDGNVLTNSDVCQQVYLYVETEGIESGILTAKIYDYDFWILNDDYVDEVEIVINNNVGTGVWTTKWIDDSGLKSAGINQDSLQLKSAEEVVSAECYFEVFIGETNLGNSGNLDVEDLTPPSPPVLNDVNGGNPIQAQSYETSVEFTWNKPVEDECQSEIDHYYIQVSKSSDFSVLEWDDNTTDNTTNHNFIPGIYYWRVGSVDKAGNPGVLGEMDWSDVKSFDINLQSVKLDVPYYYQGNSYYCWASSMSMLLKYYNINLKLWELAEIANESRIAGITAGGFYDILVNVLPYVNKNYGLDLKSDLIDQYSNNWTEKIINQLMNNNPIWLGVLNGFHTRVVNGFEYSDGVYKYYVHDPHYSPFFYDEWSQEELDENLSKGGWMVYLPEYTISSNHKFITTQFCYEDDYGDYTDDVDTENDYFSISAQHTEYWDQGNIIKKGLVHDGKKPNGYYFAGMSGESTNPSIADVLIIDPVIHNSNRNLLNQNKIVVEVDIDGYVTKNSITLDVNDRGSINGTRLYNESYNNLSNHKQIIDLNEIGIGKHYLNYVVYDYSDNSQIYDEFTIELDILDDDNYAAFDLITNIFSKTIFVGNNTELSIPVTNLGTQEDVFQLFEGDQFLAEATSPFATCSNINATIPTDGLSVGTYNFEYVVKSKNEPLKTRKIYLALNIVEANAPLAITPECGGYETTATPTFDWTPFSEIITGLIQKGYQLRVWKEGETETKVYDTGLILDASGNTHTYNPGVYTGYDEASQSDKISLPLDFGATYHWHVRYLDDNDNWTPWSNEFDYCTFDVVDPTPIVQILYPGNNTNYYDSEARVSGMSTDQRIVDLVEYRVNGGIWQTATGTWSWYAYTDLTPGINTIDVRAKGVEGDYSDIESVTIYFTPELEATPEQLTFASTANDSKTINLVSSLDWYVTVKPAWLSINPDNGSGDETLTFETTVSNTSGSVNQGIVTIENSNGQTVQIAVQQQTESDYISVTPNLLEFEPADYREQLNIFSNTNWTITVNDDWIDVGSLSGYNDTLIEVYTNRFENEGTRTGSVTINATGVENSEHITIIQHGIYLEVTDSMDLRYQEGSDTINVTSNVLWMVNDNVEWLQVTSGSPGENNGYFSIHFDENLNSETRTAELVVSGDGMRRVIFVAQAGIVSELHADFSSSSQNVTVNSSVQFTDESTGNPTSWLWNFGDDNISTEQNPIHIYENTGVYDVWLQVSNATSFDSIIKDSYIIVNDSLNTLECADYKLTVGKYPETGNLIDSIQFEFGTNYSIADWTDLEAIVNIEDWIACMGFPEDQTFMLTRNGENFYSTSSRQYYVHYSSDGVPYGSFSVHDQIGPLYLGSWYGIKMNVLAKIESKKLIADFTSDKTSISFGEEVAFTDLSSGDPISWLWDFGDGGTSTEQNPVHLYDKPGKFDVSCIVSNGEQSDTITKLAYINVLASETIFVSTEGSNESGDGTEFNPYLTIQFAIDVANPGDTIFVFSGNYYENIVLKDDLYVRSENNEKTTIIGQALVDGIVNFNNISNCVLDGFRITVDVPVSGYDRGVVFSYCDSSVVLMRSTIFGTQYGIFVWYPSTPVILNNTLVGINDEQGIYIGNSTTQALIINNIIAGYKWGIHLADEGMLSGNGTPIIKYNDLWNNELNYWGLDDQTGMDGNISSDPIFRNEELFNYSLMTGSPCIDAGDPSFPNDEQNSRVEIGAITYLTNILTDYWEDWEEGIDYTKWKAYGSPAPIILDTLGYNRSKGFDPNGDANYASGVVTYESFDLEELPSVSFKANATGTRWGYQHLRVAWASTDHTAFISESQTPTRLIGFQCMPEEADHMISAFVDDQGYNIPWLNETMDGVWKEYKFEINSDGTVSFYLDGNHFWTSDNAIDLSQYKNQALIVEGRSLDHPQVIDDIDLVFNNSINPIDTICLTELFIDDFSNGDLDINWTNFGNPLPAIEDSYGNGAPSYDNNGDGSYNSGSLSKATYNYSNGLVIEADFNVPINPSGCWMDASLGIAKTLEYGSTVWPGTVVNVLYKYVGEACYLDPNLEGQLIFSFITESGEIESLNLEHLNDYLESWHNFKINIQDDGYVRLYIDDSLAYSSINKISQDYNDMPIVLGARSSSYGQTLIDNVKVSEYCEEDNCPQHFHTAWEGSLGTDHMNIYALEAKIEGVDLVVGDEVGVFDGELCVGYGKVTQIINEQAELSIVVSRNDGSGNGFTPGNEISYRLWDCSEQVEFVADHIQCFDEQGIQINCSAFEAGGTANVKLDVSSQVCVTSGLDAGWNLFSSPIEPDSSDLQWNFQILIDYESLVKIQDERGYSLEDRGIYGGWQNDIGDIRPTEGYKVKLSYADSTWICGRPVQYPYPIHLFADWNIIGYPQLQSFNAMDIIQSLIDNGNLIKVQDEQGNAIENWGIYGGWQNMIGNFSPSEGYKIKVAEMDTLWIYESYPKSIATVIAPIPTQHFKTGISGNGVDHMNFNLVELPADLLSISDEIAVYDGTSCVGAVVITEDNLSNGMVSIPASATDESGTPGFNEGDDFNLRFWQSAQNREIEIETEHISGPEHFTKHESVMLSLEKSALTDLGDITGNGMTNVTCYPNPFERELVIEVNLSGESEVEIKVVNQTGQLVASLINKEQLSGGIHQYYWNTKNESTPVAPGIFYILTTIDNVQYNSKVILTR
ncbi:PKD domain-containing protein [Maribellus sediminis]|uniref:PKD domain-containing protein n=1 Tax=Maribellus sediminis TaxID=2696285 RepID=UPI001981A4C7|nr:PKD domain-containing protein [Maribellus sediminis]